MRILHFHGAARHPGTVLAQMGQADQALRPFDQYLRQAIRTARERQIRFVLPWEPVRRQRTLRLDPIDGVILVTPPERGWLLEWPHATTPDPTRALLISNRDEKIALTGCAKADARTYRILPEQPLLPDDEVVWCGKTCTVRPEPTAERPRELRDGAGREIRVRQGKEDDREDGRWRLVLEGRVAAANEELRTVQGRTLDVRPAHALDGLRCVTDEAGRTMDVREGGLRVEDLPAEGLLRGDNGVRFAWREAGRGQERSGNWVRLLLPEAIDPDETLDPRAAFCEEDVDVVLTEKWRRPETTFKVKRIARERYELLLDRFPPTGTELMLPLDVRGLELQRRAIYQLREAPLPYHQGLLRLTESPEHVRWPTFEQTAIAEEDWFELTSTERSGTEEQRRFVAKALATDDFAFLEGPPGSGKTTAVCELIRQLAKRGERVLLCGSTHVAVDNVIEKLLDAKADIEIVRIGKIDNVDRKVQDCQIDRRVDAVEAGMRAQPACAGLAADDLRRAAERVVVRAADLTCATTEGVLRHPVFRDSAEADKTLGPWERPIARYPHWDVLIVDEASKTLLQEFLVPALTARKWVIVGDVNQLPPFAERSAIVANLGGLMDDKDRPVLSPERQRARLLAWRLCDRWLLATRARWLIVEPAGVNEALVEELEARRPDALVVRIAHEVGGAREFVVEVAARELQTGLRRLTLAAADWLLVPEDLLPNVAGILPANRLVLGDLEGEGGRRRLPEDALFLFRQEFQLEHNCRLRSRYSERGKTCVTAVDLEKVIRDWFARNSWASEVAWRLTRIHELKHSQNTGERSRLQQQRDQIVPDEPAVRERVAEIEDVGLPGVIEVLQEGVGAERSRRQSALSLGIPGRQPDAFRRRFESLPYQHRMHPTIAEFAKDTFYAGKALKNANTIELRDRALGWDFWPGRARRLWRDVDGVEAGGVNRDEVEEMRRVLEEFLSWTRVKGPPQRKRPAVWEVACLSFYLKQKNAIAAMVREVIPDDAQERFAKDGVEVVCGTVDRFQGREADLVLLSMRNTRRVGFLDSPNRLNVALTRARQLLVIFGRHKNFAECKIGELEALAGRTDVEPVVRKGGGRR